VADVQLTRTTCKKVQLAVNAFREAEHLDLNRAAARSDVSGGNHDAGEATP
jgi:hypothetical protein